LEQEKTSMKQCLIDSSSAILLYKSGLFGYLFETYHIAMTASVYEELTVPGYPGAGEFRQSAKSGAVTIQSSAGMLFPGEGANSLYAMGRGERDTIRCYVAKGPILFIIIDDGRAARYCRRAGIPFINGLLFARIAFLSGLLSESEYIKKQGELVRIGRYGHEVIAFVKRSTCKEIAFFLP
jgi:hypothetical protein